MKQRRLYLVRYTGINTQADKRFGGAGQRVVDGMAWCNRGEGEHDADDDWN